MKSMAKLGVLFGFILFIAIPVFAQTAEDVDAAVENVMDVDESGEGVVVGEVVSVDSAAGKITIKLEDMGNKTFSVIGGETILWRGIEDIELSTIKNGEEAEIGYYTDEANKLIASWVDVFEEEAAE